MTRLPLALALLLSGSLSAQAPTRHFHDGEVLKMQGAEITIHMPSPLCIGKSITEAALACASNGPGFFEVTVSDPAIDYIEIRIGVETHVDGIKGTILRFQTFTSPVSADHWAVGEISNLDAIRTITVKLLKVRAEETFR